MFTQILLFLFVTALVVVYILLTTKIVAGRWFGEGNGVINVRAISSEIMVVDNGEEYKPVKPKTAQNYIIIPAEGGHEALNIDSRYFNRGMIITIVNESSVWVNLFADGIETNIGPVKPANSVKPGTLVMRVSAGKTLAVVYQSW